MKVRSWPVIVGTTGIVAIVTLILSPGYHSRRESPEPDGPAARSYVRETENTQSGDRAKGVTASSEAVTPDAARDDSAAVSRVSEASEASSAHIENVLKQTGSSPHDNSASSQLMQPDANSASAEEEPASEDSARTADDDADRGEALFAAHRKQIERELEDETGDYDRDDMLVMFGKSASASSRFARAAAAYMMFLDEFGTDHPYSPAIFMKLGQCLAPIDHHSCGMSYTPLGPKFKPQWRMQFTPSKDMLRRAVDAYEQAAQIALDDAADGRALFELGWVHRSLEDWDAATDAWLRCGAIVPGTRMANDALLLAAENLELTGRQSEAAKLLGSLATESADQQRAQLAAGEARDLEHEAARAAAFDGTNAVSLLEQEVRHRADDAPWAVYRSFSRWLGRRGDRTSQLAVQRWAIEQTEWPTEANIQCNLDLADTLLAQANVSDQDKSEAASALGEVVDLAQQASWSVPAALRRSRLLRELNDLTAADAVFASLDHETKTNPMWEPRILAERVRVKLQKGEKAEADRLLQELADRHPEYWELDSLLFDHSTSSPEQETLQ